MQPSEVLDDYFADLSCLSFLDALGNTMCLTNTIVIKINNEMQLYTQLKVKLKFQSEKATLVILHPSKGSKYRYILS